MEIQFRADALADQLRTEQLIAQKAEVFPIHGISKIVSISTEDQMAKKCFHSSTKLCAQRIFLCLGMQYNIFNLH